MFYNNIFNKIYGNVFTLFQHYESFTWLYVSALMLKLVGTKAKSFQDQNHGK